MQWIGYLTSRVLRQGGLLSWLWQLENDLANSINLPTSGTTHVSAHVEKHSGLRSGDRGLIRDSDLS